MSDPAKCNVILRSKSFEAETDTIEEWYKTKYVVRDIDDKLMNRLRRPSVSFGKKGMGLPPSNTLIPRQFELKQRDPVHAAKPLLVHQSENTELWYQKDDKFDRPKCKISVKVYTNDCGLGSHPQSRVFAHLWTQVFNEYTREFNYMASCASLKLSVLPRWDHVLL